MVNETGKSFGCLFTMELSFYNLVAAIERLATILFNHLFSGAFRCFFS